MLKIGCIGFGQAGGLFADAAKNAGFGSLAFNTARVDLSGLTHLNEKERFHLSGYEGAGKNRDIGQEAFQAHRQLIEETISQKMHDYHVLMPVFALGGGTASGMVADSLQLMTERFGNKVIAPILLFPHESESLRAHMNTLEAFSALSANEDLGATFIIDNQKVQKLYPSFRTHERYELVRTKFLSLLQRLNETTEQSSDVSNIDAMDLLTVLSERGAALFSEIATDTLTENPIESARERLVDSFLHTPFADTDMSHMAKVAFVLESEKEKEWEVNTLLEGVATPLETFVGMYTGTINRLTTLVTGLPFPVSKLKQFESLIQDNEQRVMHSLSIARHQQYDNQHSWTQTLKRKRKTLS